MGRVRGLRPFPPAPRGGAGTGAVPPLPPPLLQAMAVVWDAPCLPRHHLGLGPVPFLPFPCCFGLGPGLGLGCSPRLPAALGQVWGHFPSPLLIQVRAGARAFPLLSPLHRFEPGRGLLLTSSHCFGPGSGPATMAAFTVAAGCSHQ